MADDLYERYKEALRRGHVAVLRGLLEEAIEAYQEAAAIAPARALPHTSLGGVYLRLNRVEEALAEYAAAVARSPQDEGALLGQADALGAVGRFEDAAAALDRVAAIQEAAARLPEASDTLRRALDLDEDPERVRRQRALQRQIRLSAGDQAAEAALARALRLREEPLAEAIPSPVPASVGQAELSPQSELALPIQPGAEGEQELATIQSPRLEPDTLETPAGTDASLAEPEIATAEESVDVTVVDATVEPQPTADELAAAAEAAEAAGEAVESRRLFVIAARRYATEGRFDAGLDIAQALIRDYPSDVDAHLVLVELYVSRNWQSVAAEKLLLLGRLADLDNDEEARLRLCAAASQAFPGNARLAALCA